METEFEKGVRPWGGYQVLHVDGLMKVKRIVVTPKGRLSLQYHHKRSEHWFIVQGRGKMEVGDAVWIVEKGDSMNIAVGLKHRIENVGTEDLIFVEVQTGEAFDEDDIVRISDDYGR